MIISILPAGNKNMPLYHVKGRLLQPRKYDTDFHLATRRLNNVYERTHPYIKNGPHLS